MAEKISTSEVQDEIPFLAYLNGDDVSQPVESLDDVKEIKDKIGVSAQSYYEIKDPPDKFASKNSDNMSKMDKEFEDELQSYFSGYENADPPEEDVTGRRKKPKKKDQVKSTITEEPEREPVPESRTPEPEPEPDMKPEYREVSRENPRRKIIDDRSQDEEATVFLGRNHGSERKDPILKNLTTGDIYRINCNPCTIGKSLSCDIQIPDKVISRHHAEITQYGDKWFIRDHSTNGTYINGLKIPQDTEVELKNNTDIILANKRFKFHI